MVNGDADCEGPLEEAIDQGLREEGHHPTVQTLPLVLASLDVPDLGFLRWLS